MTAQPATIQVKYVNQPKEAHWNQGSVKDANGQLFNIAKECLGYFQVGETCEILWEQTGKYPTIVGKGGQLFPQAPIQQQPGAGAPQMPQQPQTAAQAWKAPLAPKPLGVAAPPLTYDKPADKEEGMFIMGVVGRAMGSGEFDIVQIPELTRVARWAWQTRHSPGVAEMETEVTLSSPAHQARNPDTQYGGQHPDAPPMGDPNDPGYQ